MRKPLALQPVNRCVRVLVKLDSEVLSDLIKNTLKKEAKCYLCVHINSSSLLPVAAQIESAFVLDYSQPHLIEPAASAQHIAFEIIVRSEVNSHIE